MNSDTKLIRQSRVQRKTPADTVTTTRLSILDNTAVGFAPCAAIWLYDSSPSFKKSESEDHQSLLLESLCQTLDSYPHWSGQLSWDNSDPAVVGRRTAGRLLVTYGSPNDPGVDFRTVEYPAILESICPSIIER